MDTRSPRDIINQIGGIREAANLLIERELKRRGLKGIVPAHGVVFAFLFGQTESVPIKSLVNWAGRVKSTVTGMVNTLERHGYVYKQGCDRDARSIRIGLTEKGWAIKRDFEEISNLLEQTVFGDMPQDECRHLVGLLSKIEENLKR